MSVMYELVEADDNFWGIKLLDTEFAGIVYRYGEIKFLGEDEQGNGMMSFEYDIIDPLHFNKEELVGEKIDQIMGQVLHQIIVESLDRIKTKDENESDGTVDT